MTKNHFNNKKFWTVKYTFYNSFRKQELNLKRNFRFKSNKFRLHLNILTFPNVQKTKTCFNMFHTSFHTFIFRLVCLSSEAWLMLDD